MRSISPQYADLVSLLKPRLSAAIAASALAGYLLQRGDLTAGSGIVFLGVLALSAGCGALNNCQDRSLDRRLERTRGRPLPAGRISLAAALTLSALLMALGLGALALGPFPRSAAVGAAAAAFCYNGLYTPLKTRTALALVPGIACGALPPLIGWQAAGGTAWSVPAWGLMAVFGLWQPPHFWLVVLAHPADYRATGIPSMLQHFSPAQLARILFIWVTALGASILALPMAMGMHSAPLAALILADGAALLALFGQQLFLRGRPPRFSLLFAALNLSVLVALALIALHRTTGAL